MNDRINPLAKSSVVYIIATIIGQAASFLGVIVFTRIMDQGDYGRYSTYYAYVSILTVLVGANLFISINNAYIDHKGRINEFRKTVLVLSGITAAIVTAASCIVCILARQKDNIYMLMIAALHGYSFFVVNYRIRSANMENDYKKKQWLLVMPNILQFAVSFILVLILPDMSFLARAVGSTLGVFVCAGTVVMEMMHCKGRLIVYSDWKYALSISLPTIVMSLSSMLMQQCDKVMLTSLCGPDATAAYSVIYYFGYAMTAVNQAVSAVRQVWIYNRLAGCNMQGIWIIQKWYLVVMAFIAAGTMMVAPEVLRLLVPDSYWQFQYVVPFVAGAGMMVLYGFYTDVVMFYKRNSMLSAAVLFSAVVNIGLNCLFIPRVGAIAAAYTTVAAYLILFLLLAQIAKADIRGVYSKVIFAGFILFIGFSGIVYIQLYRNVIARYLLFGTLLLFMLSYVYAKREEWQALLLREDRNE